MKIITITCIIFFVSLPSFSCNQEIESISGTIHNQATYNIINEWNGTIYNMSTFKIDEPGPIDPKPVVTPHYDPSFWMWILILLGLFFLIIKNPVRNPKRDPGLEVKIIADKIK